MLRLEIMSIDLSQNTENIINEKVQMGLYGSADELVTEALSLLDKQDAYRFYINSALQEAESSFDRGEFFTPDQLKEHINSLREDFLKSN